jgi:hypothetical protein
MSKSHQQVAALKSARAALTAAEIPHDEMGANVTLTAPDGEHFAVVVVTMGDVRVSDVRAALDEAAVSHSWRDGDPWRIRVTAPTVEHVEPSHGDEIPVEDDGHAGEFDEVGSAVPETLGVRFDRDTARTVEAALMRQQTTVHAWLVRAERQAGADRLAHRPADEDVAEMREQHERLVAAERAVSQAIVEFDARVESVEGR